MPLAVGDGDLVLASGGRAAEADGDQAEAGGAEQLGGEEGKHGGGAPPTEELFTAFMHVLAVSSSKKAAWPITGSWPTSPRGAPGESLPRRVGGAVGSPLPRCRRVWEATPEGLRDTTTNSRQQAVTPAELTKRLVVE